jgi:hypothetical protein
MSAELVELRQRRRTQGGWIQTATGGQFWPMDTHQSEISILDIARSLSKLCRFNGHCKGFYSVAQHSVLVSHQCDPADAMWGLLHDAPEAYLADVPTPLKNVLHGYRDAERAIMREICRKFNLPEQMPQSVRVADERMLATEKRDLMLPEPAPWPELPEPYLFSFELLKPGDAARLFEARFVTLRGEVAR